MVQRGVATPERRTARRAFWLFLTVAIVCTAQVGWWLIFHIGEADRFAELRWGVLGTARDGLNARLVSHYARVWYEADVFVRGDSEEGVPATLAGNDAILAVTRGTAGAAADADSAWRWVISDGDDTLTIQLDPTYPERFLARYGPSLRFAGEAPLPGCDPWLETANPIRIRPAEAEAIEQDRHRSVVMFASEGSFFVFLIILGAYLIYRAVRQSAELRRRQQNFIAAVTHELKAPLASVKLYAETLERPQIERAKQLVYLGRMIEDVARLESLIDNILLAGRMEQKGFHLKPQRNNLSNDIVEYLEAMRGFLERNDFELTQEIEPDLFVHSDYDALRRVVAGIVENAVNYSGERKEARLSLARHGENVALQLQDYGVGVPPEEIDRVFDAFYRVGDEMTRKIKGTGLGLYLVREMVVAHGGTVRLESAGNGQGTTVTVTLKGVK